MALRNQTLHLMNWYLTQRREIQWSDAVGSYREKSVRFLGREFRQDPTYIGFRLIRGRDGQLWPFVSSGLELLIISDFVKNNDFKIFYKTAFNWMIILILIVVDSTQSRLEICTKRSFLASLGLRLEKNFHTAF